MLRSQKVDLTFLILFSYFYSLFDLFFFILFLRLRLGLEQQGHAVTQQVTSEGRKSHDKWKGIESSRRNDIILHVIYMVV